MPTPCFALVSEGSIFKLVLRAEVILAKHFCVGLKLVRVNRLSRHPAECAGGDEGDRQCGRPDLRSLAEQPSGKLTSTFPTTGRGDGAVQRHQDPAEVRLRPCLDPHPLQPPTPSQPPRHFQTSPSHRLGRMASTCRLRVLYYGFFCTGPVSLTMS